MGGLNIFRRGYNKPISTRNRKRKLTLQKAKNASAVIRLVAMILLVCFCNHDIHSDIQVQGITAFTDI